jgi:transcriptional regulator with XRE-family HTH domain
MSLLAKSQDAVLKDLAARVRAARLSREWSQEELAARAAIPLPTYRLFERTGRIALPRFVAIAAALGRLGEIEGLFQPRPESLEEVAGQQPRRRRGRTLG